MHVSQLISAIFIITSSIISQKIPRVRVDVYYESLCPFARRFMVEQLYEGLKGDLSKYVDLVLIPYGKAKTTRKNDTYEFECDHDIEECYGNQLQACALKLIDNGKNSTGLGFNRGTLGFIKCLMNTTNSTKLIPDIDECTAENKIDIPTADAIKYCPRSIFNENGAGSLYLARLGNLTRDFQNPLRSVPTIVFNSNFTREESDLATENFITALCKHIQGNKPKECAINSEAACINVSRLGFLLLAVAFSRFFY